MEKNKLTHSERMKLSWKDRKIKKVEAICECGCGKKFLTNETGKGIRKYIHGHNARNREVSYETRKKISDGNIIAQNIPSVRAKQLKSLKVANMKPEVKLKRSESKKRFNKTEEGKKVLIRNGIKKRGTLVSESTRKKISETLLKKEIRYNMSLDTKKSISMGLQGISDEKKWDGFITNTPYPKEYSIKLKNTIKDRDNYRCMVCNTRVKKDFHVHHIDYNKNNNNYNNLISLCRKDHARTNGNRVYWINYFQTLLNERYGYMYNNKLLLSTEAPIKYLDEIDSSQDYLFIIGHHLLDNKKYFEYCKNSTKYKILDNSCYELKRSIEPKVLKKLSEDISADVVIIPDVLFNKKESIILEKEFRKLYRVDERKKIKFMKVVCGNTVKEYEDSVREILSEDVDIIGISQSRTMVAPNLSYIMTLLTRHARELNEYSKMVHLLGLQHIYEVIESTNWNRIKTIDTGSPINFAYKNLEYPKIAKAEDFKRESGEDLESLKELNVELAKKNIDILKSYYVDYLNTK